MKWYVYWYDANAKKIITQNVFELSGRFNNELKKIQQTTFETFTDFSDSLQSAAMYCFWSKCEHEICVCDWMEQKYGVKVDVYAQLRLNWEPFVNYVWDNLMEE